MLLSGESISKRPGRAIARLLAQIQPIAITEQHRLAGLLRPFDRERREFRACHFVPLLVESQLRIQLQTSYRSSYKISSDEIGRQWKNLAKNR